MTLSEFNAWLDGFSEGVRDAPTPEQWARIRAKLADVREAGPYTIPNPAPYPRSPSIPAWPGRPWEVTCGQANTTTSEGTEAILTGAPVSTGRLAAFLTN